MAGQWVACGGTINLGAWVQISFQITLQIQDLRSPVWERERELEERKLERRHYLLQLQRNCFSFCLRRYLVSDSCVPSTPTDTDSRWSGCRLLRSGSRSWTCSPVRTCRCDRLATENTARDNQPKTKEEKKGGRNSVNQFSGNQCGLTLLAAAPEPAAGAGAAVGIRQAEAKPFAVHVGAARLLAVSAKHSDSAGCKTRHERENVWKYLFRWLLESAAAMLGVWQGRAKGNYASTLNALPVITNIFCNLASFHHCDPFFFGSSSNRR